MHPSGPGHYGVDDRGILAMVTPERLRRILTKMLDENEFLSPFGIRSLRNSTNNIHSFSMSKAANTGWTIYLPSRTAACSVATPTGVGTYLDACEHDDHPSPLEFPYVLR